MSRLPFLLACLVLVSTGSAFAATSPEAAQAEVARARTQASELRTRRGTLKQELDQLGARIEALKAERRGKLLSGGELESLLRRSQELSGSLTELAAQLQTSEAQVEQASVALLSALSDELTRLRAGWERSTSSDERRQLLEQMRRLRAERERLRASLPPAALPTLSSSAASDDPEDLLEQVDALRDAEDKVRQRLSALNARITEAREERELDRRMGEFSTQGSLFDEQERRLRLDRDPRTQEFGGVRAVFGTPEVQDTQVSTSRPPGGGERQMTSPGGSRAPDAPNARSFGAGAGDGLEQLEAERAQLNSFVEELRAKARELEARARELK